MRSAAVLLCLLCAAPILSSEESAGHALDIQIRVERSLLRGDLDRYEGVYSTWSQEYARYRALHDGLAAALKDRSAAEVDVASYMEQIQVQWTYVAALQDRMTDIGRRIVDRMTRIDALKAELDAERSRTSAGDPLTGKWAVLLQPGDQEGTFDLKLSTTLLTGSYKLAGGWTGSLKGTLVGDRVRLERIDSEKGFIAVYYGRFYKEEGTMSGTWEATMFTTGGPMTGTWSAKKIHEP